MKVRREGETSKSFRNTLFWSFLLLLYLQLLRSSRDFIRWNFVQYSSSFSFEVEKEITQGDVFVSHEMSIKGNPESSTQGQDFNRDYDYDNNENLFLISRELTGKDDLALIEVEETAGESHSRRLVAYRSTCDASLMEPCSTLYFLSGVNGTASLDLLFHQQEGDLDDKEEEVVTFFDNAKFGEVAKSSVYSFFSLDYYLSSVTSLNPNSVVTVRGHAELGNTSSVGGTVIVVASEHVGNEIWVFTDNDPSLLAQQPCGDGGNQVIFGNSINDGETLYTISPSGDCSKLEMDRSTGPPFSTCQTENFTWNIYLDFQCTSQVVATASVNASAVKGPIYCITIGSGVENVTLHCISQESEFSEKNLDYNPNSDSVLPYFLQNNLPIIGGSGAGVVIIFLLLVVGVHKYQHSGLVDFTVGDVVIYKLTPAQQKRQRIHNLTKGYDYIKDRGLAVVVSVPAPIFVSPGSSREADREAQYKANIEGQKTVLCLQPLKRVARPINRTHTNFFATTPQTQQNRRQGVGNTASSAISLIREGEMEIELTVDESQRPVSCNYWGIRGGRVLSVVPVLWRRRIKLEVSSKDLKIAHEIEERRGKSRAESPRPRHRLETASHHSDATAAHSTAGSGEGSGGLGASGSATRRLDMLSFLDVTYTTNPDGKGEWVSRAKVAKGLRRRSPTQRPGEGDLTGEGLSPGRSSRNLIDRRQSSRLDELKEKRSKRESVRRTILTTDRKEKSEAGFCALLQGFFFRNSISESERKRLTKIQDETIRLSSAPRKLRLQPGRNDLAVLFAGKEASKKLWEKLPEQESDEEDEDGDEEEEDWWKSNAYDDEVLALQPFLKSISRSESVRGRQSAAGIGFSYVVENCRELELDKVAYSVWHYPFSEHDELAELERESDGHAEGSEDDGDIHLEGSGSERDDRENACKESALEMTPPSERSTPHHHRLQLTRGDRDRDRDRDSSGGATPTRQNSQVRGAEESQLRGQTARRQPSGGSSQPRMSSNDFSGGLSPVSPPPPLRESRPAERTSDRKPLPSLQPLVSSGQKAQSGLPSPRRQDVLDSKLRSPAVEAYVTPPHRMKSIVSRSTKVSGSGQQVLTNESTKSNSADKQHLSRVGDGLVSSKEGSGRRRNESHRQKDSRTRRNFEAEERAFSSRPRHQQQGMEMIMGSSLESDDEVDGAPIRRGDKGGVSIPSSSRPTRHERRKQRQASMRQGDGAGSPATSNVRDMDIQEFD